jgi:hypothetical protein
MSKIIRRIPGRKKEIGAALIVALQLTALTLIGLMAPFASGPQQPANAPAEAEMSAAQTQTVQARTVQPLTPADKSALRKSAVFAKKLYEPLAAQIFNLAGTRAESAQQLAQQGVQDTETPNGPTLTTDQEDYQPYTYVYFTGTGFQPGETVNMIVVEIDPVQQSFEPWDVVADENGNFQTSWYIFSEEFRGATLQATATGQSSQLTASAIFILLPDEPKPERECWWASGFLHTERLIFRKWRLQCIVTSCRYRWESNPGELGFDVTDVAELQWHSEPRDAVMDG